MTTIGRLIGFLQKIRIIASPDGYRLLFTFSHDMNLE